MKNKNQPKNVRCALIQITDGRYRGTLTGLSLNVLIFFNLWPDFNFLQPSMANQIQARSKEYQNSSQASWTVFISDTLFTELQSGSWWTYIAQNHNASFCSHVQANLWWLVNNDHYLRLLAPDSFSGSLDCWIILQLYTSSFKQTRETNQRNNSQKTLGNLIRRYVYFLGVQPSMWCKTRRSFFHLLVWWACVKDTYIQKPKVCRAVHKTESTKLTPQKPLKDCHYFQSWDYWCIMTTQDGELFP
jgi:hypothetical protein